MIKPKVITEFPVAYESKDHLVPHGTVNDNTKNGAYVRELIKRFGEGMAYLDLGCAGGGFVKQFIDRNVLAVGLEGSDTNLKTKRAEWATIPDYLFTADITKPFEIQDEDGKLIQFDAVSLFDVFEHIHKHDLDAMMENIEKHLKVGGLLIAGIATFDDPGYHVTLEPFEWWDKYFFNRGFVLDENLENFGRQSSLNLVYRKT